MPASVKSIRPRIKLVRNEGGSEGLRRRRSAQQSRQEKAHARLYPRSLSTRCHLWWIFVKPLVTAEEMVKAKPFLEGNAELFKVGTVAQGMLMKVANPICLRLGEGGILMKILCSGFAIL